MSDTLPQPSLHDLPVDGVPSDETLRHGAPVSLDPEMIARLANAFFQAPPNAVAQPSLPLNMPAATPNITDTPAPSVVTTVAPYAPARAPYGPPDIPQTTIPSVVPTPNIPQPTAPTDLRSPTRPLGFADIPQPGASLGGATPAGVPGEIDYSAIPRLLAGDLALVPPANVGALGLGAPTGAVPGGVAPVQSGELYFLDGRSPDAPAPGNPPQAAALVAAPPAS
jgi:cysteine desulfurase/selenocysteine lyase